MVFLYRMNPVASGNRFIYPGFLFCFTLAILSLYLAEYAKAVPSMAMIGLIVFACWHTWYVKPDFNANRDLTMMSVGMMLLYAIQFLTSESYPYLLERIQIKLPIMLLPLAFMMGPELKRNDLRKIGMVFLAITLATELFILIRFACHFDAYMELIRKSQNIPGPINHIRFSLMCVMSVALAFDWLFVHRITNQRYLRWFLFAVLFTGIVFVHAYSVRSGLLALYGIMMFTLIRTLLKEGSRRMKWLLMLLILLLPLAAWMMMPSIRQKITASLHDIQHYRENLSNEFNSLGKRMVSYQVALKVFKENPVLGCGIGDLEKVNTEHFRRDHPDVETVIIPHNQFIYFMMGSGLVGLILFTLSFFYPVFLKRNHGYLVWIQFLILLIAFQIEPMLETQLGVAYSILFILFARELNRADRAAIDATEHI